MPLEIRSAKSLYFFCLLGKKKTNSNNSDNNTRKKGVGFGKNSIAEKEEK